MTEGAERRVRARAKDRCEYCQLPQSASPLTFHLDHIIAQYHGGKTSLGNLALSCPHCNRHKGSNVASYLYEAGKKELTPLYNPRRHRWGKHFRWHGPLLIGLTAIGRATILVLAMNDSDVLEMRRALIAEGVFLAPIDDAEAGLP
jgi:HNH endonuclease